MALLFQYYKTTGQPRGRLVEEHDPSTSDLGLPIAPREPEINDVTLAVFVGFAGDGISILRRF